MIFMWFIYTSMPQLKNYGMDEQLESIGGNHVYVAMP